ncbi:MAG TPA: hypothetical protein VMB73_02840, partial [Acetobacteraceae bacterium]|nr:hypothetical protein [Acetobacteraceae bacterium]
RPPIEFLSPFVQLRRIANRAAYQPDPPTGMVIFPLGPHHHAGLLTCRDTGKGLVYRHGNVTRIARKCTNQQ